MNKNDLYVLRKARKSGVTGVIPPPPAPPTPPPPPPGPATPQSASETNDVNELRQYMWDNYGYSVKKALSAQDFSLVRDGVQSIEDLIKEFPQVLNQFSKGSLGIGNKESKTKVYAHATAWGTIEVNKKWFANKAALEKQYAHDLKVGYHPKGTKPSDIVAHEFGHTLHAALMRKQNDFDWKGNGTKIVQEAYNALKGTAWAQKGGSNKNGSKTMLDMRKDISGYAAAQGKPYEAIAEAVADYHRNGSNARPLSKEIWKILKRELG